MDFREVDNNARQRLKAARLQSGKHPDQLCRYTGNSPSSYYDVENCDSDLSDSLDLQDIRDLCRELGISVRRLFGFESVAVVLTPEEIVKTIKEHLATKAISQESFETQAGYYLSAALANPQSIWKDWNLDCLRNVCGALGLNW